MQTSHPQEKSMIHGSLLSARTARMSVRAGSRQGRRRSAHALPGLILLAAIALAAADSAYGKSAVAPCSSLHLKDHVASAFVKNTDRSGKIEIMWQDHMDHGIVDFDSGPTNWCAGQPSISHWH
jgi:hypothetical protein